MVDINMIKEWRFYSLFGFTFQLTHIIKNREEAKKLFDDGRWVLLGSEYSFD